MLQQLEQSCSTLPVDSDLLALLRRRLADPRPMTEDDVAFLINKVHGPGYSASNLFADLRQSLPAFISALESDPELSLTARESLDRKVHFLLDDVFALVLQQTAGAYERMVEAGALPICQIDCEGRILYANTAMLRLVETDPLIGANLADCFEESQKQFVTQAVASAVNQLSTSRRELQLLRRSGSTVRVTIDIQPLDLTSCSVGAYVTFVDLSKAVALQEKFLDRLALAAIKLDRNFRITYANPATLVLLGSDRDIRGLSVYDIFPRTATVSAQMDKRRTGEGDLYETEILRCVDRKTIPVCVAGTPILDEDGSYVGTLGIVRSLERERVSEDIHKLMETESDPETLLTGVAQQIGRSVPFDYFGISRFSLSSDHISSFYAYTVNGPFEYDRRWWPMSAEQKLDYKSPQIIWEYDAYVRLRRPDYATEPNLKKFLELNFLSAIRIPIWREERLVASILLLSRKPHFYTQEHLDQLEALPLEQAVQLALSFQNHRESQFRYQLFRRAIGCASPCELASILVTELANHYKWHHVAIFQVCEERNSFHLLAEHFEHPQNALPPENHEQPIDLGILGQVYRTRQAINIPDVHQQDLPFVSGWVGISSEICIPLIWEGDVHWLLNVEDRRVDAFSKDEESDLRLIASEAEFLLAKMSRQHLLESAFESSSDAVFLTNTRGLILSANPAAAKLLGFDKPDDVLGPFARLFKEEQAAVKAFESTGTFGREIELQRADGRTIPALITGSELPAHLSRKLFSVKDLRLIKRIEKLEGLKKLFEEVAQQSHTPLALVEAWLQRIKICGGSEATPEWATKVIRQLKKADISYERLALCVDSGRMLAHTQKQPLDLGIELKRTVEEFPASEAKQIHLNVPDNLPYVNGDPGQISFIFSTVLAYLLRCLGPEDLIDVSASHTEKGVHVSFAASIPPPQDSAKEDHAIARARFELALGESAVRAFARNNSATYKQCSTTSGTLMQLEFTTAG